MAQESNKKPVVRVRLAYAQFDETQTGDTMLRFAFAHDLVMVSEDGEHQMLLKAGYALYMNVEQMGYGADIQADRLYNEAMTAAAAKWMRVVDEYQRNVGDDDLPFELPARAV